MFRSALIFAAATVAWADVTAPCGPIGAGHVHGISQGPGIDTYCVSDWGSSDSWYVLATPGAPDLLYDALSGDDAVNIRYSINNILRSGTGWLPPVMDAGFRAPNYATGSAWAITQGLNNGPIETSAITNPNGNLDVTITTGTLAGLLFYQDYILTNGGNQTIQGIRFADYFNYHPNGSTNGGYLLGTANYTGIAGILITGVPGPVPPAGNYLAPGQMCGASVGDTGCSRLANAWDLGSAQPTPPGPGSPLKHVENNAYNDAPAPFGPGDAAGALAWDLGDLAPGQSVSIRILKGPAIPLEQIPDVPEPGTWALGIGGLVVSVGLRRLRK